MNKIVKKLTIFGAFSRKWPYFDGIFDRFFLAKIFSSFRRLIFTTLFYPPVKSDFAYHIRFSRIFGHGNPDYRRPPP